MIPLADTYNLSLNFWKYLKRPGGLGLIEKHAYPSVNEYKVCLSGFSDSHSFFVRS